MGEIKLEKELEKKIVQYAKDKKILTYKFSSPSCRGVPDRIFINKSGVVFFIEFKNPHGKMSQMQFKIKNDLEEYSQDVYVVKDEEFGIEIIDSYAEQK